MKGKLRMNNIDINSCAPWREGKHPEFRSSEKGCVHIGRNPAPAYIRQFKVDGEIFKKGAAEEKCDYLLLNDDAHKAYYIELKGSDIPKAIRQVENAIRLLHHGAIADYEVFCRIVYHTGSHSVRGNTALKWLAKRKGKALIKERVYEENVS